MKFVSLRIIVVVGPSSAVLSKSEVNVGFRSSMNNVLFILRIVRGFVLYYIRNTFVNQQLMLSLSKEEMLKHNLEQIRMTVR